MKKSSTWAGIIGLLLVAIGLAGGAGRLSNPSDIMLVNVSTAVTNLLYFAVGVFLIILFFKGKQAQDEGKVSIGHEPNSPEDVASLKKKRNWIFGFVLLFLIIASVDSYILNNYAAGFTLINIEVIFDLVMNAVFLYLAIELFRGKKNVLMPLLYAVIFQTVVEGILDGLRHDWWSIALGCFLIVYFAYAILASVNRKNHRIAHLIILPIVLVLILALYSLSNIHLNQLTKNEAGLEQEYVSAEQQTGADYAAFLQIQYPSTYNIQNLQNDIAQSEQLNQQDVSAINQLQGIYGKQLPSSDQALALERFQRVITILDIEKQQLDTLGQFMDYDAKINFNNVTAQEQAEMNTFVQKIEGYQSQITAAQVKLNNN